MYFRSDDSDRPADFDAALQHLQQIHIDCRQHEYQRNVCGFPKRMVQSLKRLHVLCSSPFKQLD